MRTTFIVMTMLLCAALPLSAQSDQSDLDSLVFEGRVVNAQGIPLKGTIVSSAKLGVFGATGGDGSFIVKLPIDGDEIIVQKEGLAEYRHKVWGHDSGVILLGEQQSSFMNVKEYNNKMKDTAKSYFEMGLNTIQGKAKNPDYKKAMACFLRAVNMGHSASAYYLGKMFEEGTGITQNYGNAIYWYKKAQDNVDAQRRLGEMYAEGIGVEKNEDEAVRYYYAAVRAGDSLVALPRLKQLEQELAQRTVDKVYEVVETNAGFPGGDQDCYGWLAKHIKYPPKAQENNIQGRVFVQFVVDKDGSIMDVKAVRSPHPWLSREAVRVVSEMPKWKPAMRGGKPVRSRFNLPIMFKLSSGETSSASSGGDDRVFEVVETNAEFPGGEQVLREWLSKNMKYPKIAQEKGIQGSVSVQFVVDKDGSISDVKVLRSPDPSLSKEAERLVSIMPKWKPAMQGGKPVRSRFIWSPRFRLQ